MADIRHVLRLTNPRRAELGNDGQHIPELDRKQHAAGFIRDLDSVMQINPAVFGDADCCHFEHVSLGTILGRGEIGELLPFLIVENDIVSKVEKVAGHTAMSRLRAGDAITYRKV